MQGSDVSRKPNLDTLGDTDLVDLACQNFDGAFRTIMQRHNRRLYRIARAVMRNDSEAEDVVQEAYVRAFTNLAEFRGDSSLATWLSRIVLNEALGRIRQRRPAANLARLESRSPSKAEIIPFHLHNSIPNAPWRNVKFNSCWNRRSTTFRMTFESCWLLASSRK